MQRGSVRWRTWVLVLACAHQTGRVSYQSSNTLVPAFYYTHKSAHSHLVLCRGHFLK